MAEEKQALKALEEAPPPRYSQVYVRNPVELPTEEPQPRRRRFLHLFLIFWASYLLIKLFAFAAIVPNLMTEQIDSNPEMSSEMEVDCKKGMHKGHHEWHGHKGWHHGDHGNDHGWHHGWKHWKGHWKGHKGHHDKIAALEETEEPKWTMTYEGEGFQIREYDAQLRATVQTNGDLVESEGFRPLASYIFGQNVDKEGNSVKIPMTKPVLTFASANHTAMSFILPASLYKSVEELPTPKDENVVLSETSRYVVAVINGTGRWTMRNVDEMEAKLREAVKTDGNYKVVGSAVLARYDSPMSLPWKRRTEVWLTAKKV